MPKRGEWDVGRTLTAAAGMLVGLLTAGAGGGMAAARAPVPLAGEEPALVAGVCRMGSVVLLAPRVDNGGRGPDPAVELTVDQEPAVPCPLPVAALPGLPPGPHRFTLRLAGLKDPPPAGTVCRFTVDLPAPDRGEARLTSLKAAVEPGGVQVRAGVKGFSLSAAAMGGPRRPGEGHLLVFADGRLLGAFGVPGFRLVLPPGPHRLTVGLYDNGDVLAGSPGTVVRTLAVTVPGTRPYSEAEAGAGKKRVMLTRPSKGLRQWRQ